MKFVAIWCGLMPKVRTPADRAASNADAQALKFRTIVESPTWAGARAWALTRDAGAVVVLATDDPQDNRPPTVELRLHGNDFDHGGRPGALRPQMRERNGTSEWSPWRDTGVLTEQERADTKRLGRSSAERKKAKASP